MQSLFGGGELGLLGGGGGGGGGDAGTLKEDGCGSVAWNSSTLAPEDVYSASHFALITAYQDIKTRLACLERENTSIKRKLKMYEIKVRAAAASVALPCVAAPTFIVANSLLPWSCCVPATIRREGLGGAGGNEAAEARDPLEGFQEGEGAAHSAVALSVFIEGCEVVHKDERGGTLMQGWRGVKLVLRASIRNRGAVKAFFDFPKLLSATKLLSRFFIWLELDKCFYSFVSLVLRMLQ